MTWLKRLARPASILLGAIFVFAAIMKLRDINSFAVQVDGYGVVPDKSWLGPIAVGTVALEMLLGAALVLGLHLRGWTAAATVALLVVFTVLIANGWVFHDLESCGCFGVAMSPGSSIAKNIGLIALGLLALFGHRQSMPEPPRIRLLAGGASLLAAVVAAAVAVATLDPGPSVAPIAPGDRKNEAAAPGPYAGITVASDLGTYDLGQGEYLVALVSATCEHCMASVPMLNELTYFPDLPPLVGLVLEENPGDMENFKAQTGAAFPLHSLGDRPLMFYNLIGAQPPRLVVVQNGWPRKYWDGDMPDYPEALSALAEALGAEAEVTSTGS